MRAFRLMLPFYTPDIVNSGPNVLGLCYILESVGCSLEREEFGFKNLILLSTFWAIVIGYIIKLTIYTGEESFDLKCLSSVAVDLTSTSWN